jgi:TPR repeat protein
MTSLRALKRFLLRTDGVLSDTHEILITDFSSSTINARSNVERCLKVAETGDKVAATVCHYYFREGYGIEKDASYAFYWAQEAARAGFAPGLYVLACCLDSGIGVPVDRQIAKAVFLDSASAGYPLAMTHLALSCTLGNPYGLEAPQARQLLESAFKLGEPDAGAMLGHWYEHGEVVEASESLAKRWYLKAADRGSFIACVRVAAAYRDGALGFRVDRASAREFELKSLEADAP